MSTTDLGHLLAESACRNLVLDYATVVDSQDYDGLMDLFTADATFARPTAPDTIVQGAAQIVRAFASRPRDKVSQHLCMNIRIHVESADRATGTSSLILFMGDAAEALAPGTGRKVTMGPLMGTYADEFVRTAEGWRFSARRGQVTLRTG